MAETIRKNVDLDILDYYDTKIKDYVDDKVGTGGVTIDTALSDTSTNPVQNKVIKAAIDDKADKTVATTEANGLMSASDKKRFNNIGNVYALKSLYGDTTIDVGRKTGTDVGICSDAEGWHTTASGNYSHTEGLSTTASNRCSHAEGVSTVASGESSHAEGVGAVAFGDYSHARGYNTITNNTCETASGKYNVSNDNTLFSIGDGTADDARHNAFEITTDGGKLHDKDIATTDLIPTSLPANGGNADTLDGLHADDFVNATNFGQIQIPSNVDVPAWMFANGKKYQQYMTNSTNVGMTNVPNNAGDYVWYWRDGLNILAREWVTGRYYICDTVNGGFSGWKDIYTSGFKPYVTGSTTTATKTVTTNHGFTPSAVFYWAPSQGSWFCGSATFDTTSFQISFLPSESIVVNYLIFR